jgi:hypothetical protein
VDFYFLKKLSEKPAGKTAIPVKLNYHMNSKNLRRDHDQWKAYENLGELTKGIGPVSAQPRICKAVEWAEKNQGNSH